MSIRFFVSTPSTLTLALLTYLLNCYMAIPFSSAIR